MLLELTDTLINYSNHQERMVIDSMSNILIGYYEGNHLLMASDEVCDNFAKKIKDDIWGRMADCYEDEDNYNGDFLNIEINSIDRLFELLKEN